MKDFTDNAVLLHTTAEYITAEGLENSSSTLVPEETPVVCTRMAVGRCALTTQPTAINQDLKALLLQEDFDRRFFIRLLHHLGPELDRVSVGSTVRGITLRDLLFLPLYYPVRKSTQSRIAAVLDTVDEAIAKTEAVIAKLKQVRTGLLHDLLTRGLDEHGQLRDPIAHPEQFKNSPLGRLPRAWHLTTLIEACLKIADRDHTTPVYVAEGVRMLSPTHFVGDDEIDFEACPRISVEAHLQNRAKTDLAVDDVIIHRIGAGLGRVRLVEAGMPEFSILHSLAMIRPRPHRLRSGFLYWAIQADVIQVQMGLGTQSIGVPDLGLDKIGGVLMAIPPLGEQERIADLLNNLATNVRAELRLLRKLNCLKSGLMTDLLTGRVRVPESISTVEVQV